MRTVRRSLIALCLAGAALLVFTACRTNPTGPGFCQPQVSVDTLASGHVATFLYYDARLCACARPGNSCLVVSDAR